MDWKVGKIGNEREYLTTFKVKNSKINMLLLKAISMPAWMRDKRLIVKPR